MKKTTARLVKSLLFVVIFLLMGCTSQHALKDDKKRTPIYRIQVGANKGGIVENSLTSSAKPNLKVLLLRFMIKNNMQTIIYLRKQTHEPSLSELGEAKRP